MLEIQKKYKNAIGTIDQLQMTGDGTKIGGIYYQIVPEEEIQKVQTELKKAFGDLSRLFSQTLLLLER